KRMTIDDAHQIEARCMHCLAVEAQQDKNLQIVWRSRNANLTILGATANFFQVRGFELDHGQLFTSADDIGRQRVAVLGSGALTQLGIENPDAIIGEKVRIGGVQFIVIGTLKAKGAGGGFGSPDDQIVIPFGTSRFRLFKTDKVDDMFALASSEEDIPDAIGE